MIDPLNPPVAVVVIVDVATLPGLTVAGENAEAEMVKSGGGGLNTASKTCVELTVQTLAFVVVQPDGEPGSVPDHTPKVEPPLGVAVSVTVVPTGNAEIQSVGQFMPLGLLVTVPVPLPEKVMTTLKTGEVVAGSSNTVPPPEEPPEFAVP